MSTFAPQPQVPFTMGQWGMPQMPAMQPMQIPGADLNPMSQLNPMAGMAQPSPFLPQMSPSASYMPETGGSWGSSFAPQTNAGGGSIWDSFLTKDGNQGWGTTAMGAAGGLYNAWMGMKQYGLAKDALDTNKQQFAQNFAAQQKMTNARLADRQASRIGSSGGTNANYESVGDYMKKYGV